MTPGSQRAVAAALGVSRRTVRYVEDRAIRRLRGERVRVYRCGACGELGHTARTCEGGRTP